MRFRFAAGVCVLTTGVLIGSAGGAIAAADSDSDPLSAASGGPTGAGAMQDAGSSGALDANGADAGTGGMQKGGQGATAAPLGRTGTTTADQPAGFPSRATQTSTYGAAETAGITTSAEQSGSVAFDAAATMSETAGVTAEPSVPAADPSLGTAMADVVAPKKATVPVTTAVAPVRTAVTTVVQVVGAVPGTVWALPTTPVPDVIASIREMVTSVAGAVVPLAQVPSNLSSLLGVSGPARPSFIGRGSSYTATVITAAGATELVGPGASQVPPMVPTRSWDSPLIGDAAPLPTVIPAPATALPQELSLSGLAPVPQAVTPQALSFLEHAVTAILAPASLSALAALALPGVGGLLILCAAGMRVGYRQAKAGLTMHASGISRFAGSGPLGVVRSGSLISLRPRPQRVTKHEAAPGARVLADQAA